MFDFSFYELMVFGIIALIVLGPEKLPQAVRTVGTYYAKFRRTVGTLKAEMEAELDLAETRQRMQEELAKIKQAEAEMQREMAELRGNMKEFEAQQNSQLRAAQGGAVAAGTSAAPKDKKDWVHPVDQANPNMAAPTAVTTDYSYGNNPDSTQPAPTVEEGLESDVLNNDSSERKDSNNKTTQAVAQPMTRPWENMWFLLGDYDRARRLPPAPLLPNYKANPLLYNMVTQSSQAATSSESNANSLSTDSAAEVKS